MFEDLDELARGLAENDISRRQALKWAGYSVLGATLSSMGFAESAEALSRRKRRRCRRRGGTVCSSGTRASEICCRKGETCYFTTPLICCSNDPLCSGATSAAGPPVCYNTLGAGDICNRPTCNTDTECSAGEVCIRTPGCPGTGGNRCVPAC